MRMPALKIPAVHPVVPVPIVPVVPVAPPIIEQIKTKAPVVPESPDKKAGRMRKPSKRVSKPRAKKYNTRKI